MTSSLLRGHNFNIREGARLVTRNSPAKICLFKTTRWNMFKVINKDTDVTQVSFLLTLRILEIIFLNFWNLYFYNFVLTIFYGFIQCLFCWFFFFLREMCPNTEFFLVRIFPHSDWIMNAGVYGPEKTPYLDTFHAVLPITIFHHSIYRDNDDK